MPKIYFTDTGLACSLLDIHSEKQFSSHYMFGALFENFILSEFIKHRFNSNLRNNCYFWRDNKGVEIDCIIENGKELMPVEIKSGYTFNSDFFRNVVYWNKISNNAAKNSFVIYGGEVSRETGEGMLLSWTDLESILLLLSKKE
jgi:predicted AAA+ superfamily ATPase